MHVDIELGLEAWRRVKTGAHFSDWILIGKALSTVQKQAMLFAGTDTPHGRNYQEQIKQQFLLYPELGTIDKTIRSKLLSIIDELPQVMEWRAQLSEKEQLSINFPTKVWSHFQAFKKSADKSNNADNADQTDNAEPKKPTLKEQLLDQEKKIAELKLQLDKQSEGSLIEKTSTAKQVAEIIVRPDGFNWSPTKIRALIELLSEMASVKEGRARKAETKAQTKAAVEARV